MIHPALFVLRSATLTRLLRWLLTKFDLVKIKNKNSDENENPLNKYKYAIPLGYLFIGIGGMLTWPLSLSFIDSNAKPGESGILIATNFLIIMLGPMLGYSMGGFFLKIWVNITSGCAPELLDPRSTSWVGAWWMGYLIPLVGICIFKYG